MTHRLSEIDPDGVLPKDKISQHNDDFDNGYESGKNASNAEHKKLGVEWNIEELARALFLIQRDSYIIQDWEKLGEYFKMSFRKKAQDFEDAISQSPNVLKLVKGE